MREATQSDLDCIQTQLGRTPRDVHAIAYRCPCGKPAVVETPPRLEDGTPFPTFYYATCPRLTAVISTLETTGNQESTTKIASSLADGQPWYSRLIASISETGN